MKITNEAQQIVISYCKKWYGTTENIVEDFRIILNEAYNTDTWNVTDICEILMNNFDELVKNNLTRLLNDTIFDRYDMDKDDIKIKFLKSLKSIISLTEISYFEGLDRSYKAKFKLEEMN